MKIADSVLLSMFMRDNEKCNISHAPSTGLSDIQFSILYVLESLIPKDKTKYNNTFVINLKYILGLTFYFAHTI